MRKKQAKLYLRKLDGIGKSFDFDYVYKHQAEFVKICDEIEKNSSETVTASLKNYIIIKLVTLLENSFRKIINEEINRSKIDLKDFFDKDEISIPISALDLIKGTDVTKGDIVASNFNFQNSRDINFVFSTAAGLDFFDTIKELVNLPSITDYGRESGWHEARKGISENWSNIFDVFKMRNDVVHKDSKNIQLEIAKLRRLVDAACDLVNFSAYCIQIFIEIKNGEPRDELGKESLIAFANKSQTIIDIVKKRNMLYKQRFARQK